MDGNAKIAEVGIGAKDAKWELGWCNQFPDNFIVLTYSPLAWPAEELVLVGNGHFPEVDVKTTHNVLRYNV